MLPRADGDLVRLATARGAIVIGKAPALASVLVEVPAAPAIAGYSLRLRHPQALAERCRKAGIAVRRHGKRYVAKLPAALGGVWLFG